MCYIYSRTGITSKISLWKTGKSQPLCVSSRTIVKILVTKSTQAGTTELISIRKNLVYGL